MKLKLWVVSVSIIAMIASAMVASSMATQNKGAENLELNGGSRGNVPFPHRQHQDQIGDCKICHSVFPQKTGSIKELKTEGTLKKKYVMNKLCTKCHKEKKRAGQKSGPTTCTKCHIKAKTSN
jgi:c(7)-type cytochrome triheme protein